MGDLTLLDRVMDLENTVRQWKAFDESLSSITAAIESLERKQVILAKGIQEALKKRGSK